MWFLHTKSILHNYFQDEDRSRKFMDIVSAVVQSVQGDCSCNFTEINIPNFEFSCRSIENTSFTVTLGKIHTEQMT